MSTENLLQSVASILLSARADASNRPASEVVARQLEEADGEHKKALAKLLAEVQRTEENPSDMPREVLHSYVRSLLTTPPLEDEDTIHPRLSLAISLADLPLLEQLLDETTSALRQLLHTAQKVHPSSDDAFDLDPAALFQNYAPGMQEDSSLQPVELENREELHEAVLGHLRFWHLLFLKHVEGREHGKLLDRFGETLPVYLLAAMGLRDMKMAKPCYEVLAQFVKAYPTRLPESAPQMLWQGVSAVVDKGVNVNIALGLWLAWISTGSRKYVGPTQEMLKEEKYWKLLQKSLSTGFSERRKFTLYILMNSMELIEEPVNTSVFAFDPEDRKKLQAAWNKYTTLVEITSLSTSANQLKDATPDILRMLDEGSPIAPSWMVVLMALGFGSSSAGMHKAMWEMLIGLNQERALRLFASEDGRKFLQRILLPYAVLSNNFAMRPSEPEICNHGNSLAAFISLILQSGDKETRKTAVAILEFLGDKGDFIFTPAKLYILKGLCDGLKGKVVLDDARDLRELVRAAKMHRYTKMSMDLCIVLALRLLLAVDISTGKVGLDVLMSTLGKLAYEREHLLSDQYLTVLASHVVRSLSSDIFEQALRKEVSHLLKEEDLSTSDLTKITAMLLLLPHIDGAKIQLPNDFAGVLYNTERGLKLSNMLIRNPSEFKKVLDTQNIAGISTSMIIDYHMLSKQPSYKRELGKLLSEMPLEVFRHQYRGEAKMLSSLVKKEWEKVVAANRDEFDFEAETSRKDAAVLCTQLCRFLCALEPREPPIALRDVVDTLGKLNLPTLSSNRRENDEKIAVTESNVRSLLQLIGICLQYTSIGLVDSEVVTRIMDYLPPLSRYIVNESLLFVLESVTTILSRAPLPLGKYKALPERLLQLWGMVESCTLKHDFIKAYSGFLDIIFHTVLLEEALANKELANGIEKIATELLKIGNGKRSVRPIFAKAIWNTFMQSPRVICCSLWVQNLLMEIINFTTRSKDADFLLEQPLALIFDELEPGSDHYQDYNGELEIMAQAYIFDMLSRFDENDQIQDVFIRYLRQQLFEPWTKNHAGMPVYSPWKRGSQLQALVLLERFLTPEESGEFIRKVMDPTLAHEAHPRYRFLLEWIMALALIRYPEHHDMIWKPFEEIANPNPKLIASLLRVGVMVSRGLQPRDREAFFSQVVYTDLMLTSHTKAVIRHQAVALVLELWADANAWDYQSLTENPIFKRMHLAVIGSAYYKEYEAAKDYRTFDALNGYSLAGIFSGSYLMGADDIEIIKPQCFAMIPAGTDRPRSVPFSTTPATQTQFHADTGFTPNGVVHILPQEAKKLKPQPENTVLQTKSPSWDPALLLAPANEAKTEEQEVDKDQPELILCASLLDNPINLGGLSRISEVLGITRLTIPSLSVLASRDFQSTSVHSENHLDIQELPVPDIPDYLRSMRAEGYEVVGVEQTNSSLILGEEGESGWRGKGKTVLVLGTEKFGIPAEVLRECGVCVEIPQRGHTRSMNVQTAAGVVVYEFWRQWRRDHRKKA